MVVTELKGNGRLRTGRTELDVNPLGETLTYVLPLIGPDCYKNAMAEVDSQKSYRPTTAQILSLVDLALQNPKEPYCAEILNKFKENYLWTSTESTSFPGGVFVYDNIDGKMPSDSRGLFNLFNKEDKRVRLVVDPYFETGVISISEFLENPYTIAQIGEEMLPVAERIAKALHEKEAYVFGISKGNSDTKRLTSVYSARGVDGLSICGIREGGYNGYVSGVVGRDK